MDNIEYGNLRVKAFLAEGSIPLQGARVEVKGINKRDNIQITRFTDRDGFTDTIKLPAPSASLSLIPTPGGLPYSLYDVIVSKEGYYTEKILSVPIFSGIDSILPVNMIPISSGDVSNPPESNLNLPVSLNSYKEDNLI